MPRTSGSLRRPGAKVFVALIGLVGGLAALLLIPPTVGWTKDFSLTGTVDCGVRSGRDCPPIDDSLAVYTDDVSGRIERIVIDVSWIKRQLRDLDIEQDDQICLEVRERPSGGLQAIGITELCDLEGTVNPGLSTDDRDVSEQPAHGRGDDDEAVTTTSTTTGTSTTQTSTSTTTTSATTTTSSTSTQTAGCGTTTGSGAGSGSTTTAHQLGRTSGTFRFDFQAFTIPDRFEVFYEGKLLFDSGVVSGSGSQLLTFGPGSATFVTVRATGFDAGTLYEYAVGCPISV